MFPLETIGKASRKFLGLIVLDACSADPNVSACFSFYCGVNKSLPGNVLQLGGEVRLEMDFREQLMK